jgi:hypothetical protein
MSPFITELFSTLTSPVSICCFYAFARESAYRRASVLGRAHDGDGHEKALEQHYIHSKNMSFGPSIHLVHSGPEDKRANMAFSSHIYATAYRNKRVKTKKEKKTKNDEERCPPEKGTRKGRKEIYRRGICLSERLVKARYLNTCADAIFQKVRCRKLSVSV